MNPFMPCCVALLISLPAGLDGATIEKRFSDAQSIFDEAKSALAKPESDTVATRQRFYEAAQRFEDLAHQGVASANLYINTGNAFHFAGDDARALLWYLRANQLVNSAEVRNGILALRKVCGAKPWPHEEGSIGRALLFWHFDLSRRFKQWTMLAIYPLGCLLIIGGCFANRRSLCIRLGVAFMIVGATLGISDLVVTAHGGGRWAVVLQDSKGYAGNGKGYSVAVDHVVPGQEVRIVETRDQWTHITLPSGISCWLPTSVCQKA